MFPVVHEITLPFGSFVLHSYGVCVAVGVLLGWYAVSGVGTKTGLSARAKRTYLHATWAGVAGGAVGAAALTGHPIGEAGFSMPAWLLGVAMVLWVRDTPVPDARRLWLGTFLVVGCEALGAYLSGARFGSRGADALSRGAGMFPRWEDGALLDRGSPAWAAHLDAGWIAEDATWSLATHPVPLYECAFAVLLAVGVWRFLRPRLAPVVVGAYGLGWMGLEFLRERTFDPTAWGTLVAALFAGGLCLVAVRMVRKPAAPKDGVNDPDAQAETRA